MPSARAAHPIGPTALGLAVASVARMAIGGRHREARDRPHLAPPRLPPALDVDESAPSRSTRRSSRRPRADSDDVRSESAVGRTENPRRAREAGHRRQPNDGREIHGAPPASAVTDLAHDRRRIVHVAVTAHPTAADCPTTSRGLSRGCGAPLPRARSRPCVCCRLDDGEGHGH
jgi:hypothetical protein